MKFYRQWQAVQALTFDLDDTFYDNYPYIRRAEQRKFEFMHQSYPETQSLTSLFWRKLRTDVLTEFPHYKSDMIRLRREVLNRGLQAAGLQGEQLKEAVETVYQKFYFERSNFVVRQEVRDVLGKLAQHYPLVAITNGNVDLSRIGIADYFQWVLHADHEQPMKPDPCMFNKAVELLNLPAPQILHVGDCLKNDVMGARNAGFKTGWYADNRIMNMASERAHVLPDVEFANLAEMVELLC